MKIPKPLQADLWLLLITFVWGSTFTVVKQSLDQASPILFVAIRFWIAAIIMVACMPGQISKFTRKSLVQGLVLSVALVGGFVFQTLGLRTTSPSHSAFITSLSVLFVPLLGFFIFRHRPGLQTIAGVILATAGLSLLLVRTSELQLHSGDILTFLCAIVFAFHILFLARFVSVTDYRQLILLQLAGTAILSTFMIPLVEKPFITWNSRLILYLFVTGVLATSFALYVQARAQSLTSANHAALVFSLEPFFAALFAYWILGHVLSPREWFGGMLVISGILASELRIPGLEKQGQATQFPNS